jgi:hypothetical protein
LFSHSHNVLFIHIPKTAGQTIANYFIGLDGLAWEDREQYMMFQNGNPVHGPPQIAHLTLDEYYRSDLISDDLIDGAIKFAVVRNPWDRLWSEYNFNWQHIMSWDEFFKYFPEYIYDDHATGRDALRHILPQTAFIDDTVEVLKFENLDQDFSAFCQRHNVPDYGLRNSLNVQSIAPFESVYDAQKIKAVSDYYADDIEAFGYEAPK